MRFESYCYFSNEVIAFASSAGRAFTIYTIRYAVLQQLTQKVAYKRGHA
jgi:hypothetical protein